MLYSTQGRVQWGRQIYEKTTREILKDMLVELNLQSGQVFTASRALHWFEGHWPLLAGSDHCWQNSVSKCFDISSKPSESRLKQAGNGEPSGRITPQTSSYPSLLMCSYGRRIGVRQVSISSAVSISPSRSLVAVQLLQTNDDPLVQASSARPCHCCGPGRIGANRSAHAFLPANVWLFAHWYQSILARDYVGN